VLSCATFIISALSDQIGQKKCFQIIIFSQFIQISYWIILVQFNLSPWLVSYHQVFWQSTGGFYVLSAVAFSVVTAKTESKTSERWKAIISMQIAIESGTLLQYPLTILIQKTGTTGIKGILWASIALNTFIFSLLSLVFRDDKSSRKVFQETISAVFKGLRKIWFSENPEFLLFQFRWHFLFTSYATVAVFNLLSFFLLRPLSHFLMKIMAPFKLLEQQWKFLRFSQCKMLRRR